MDDVEGRNYLHKLIVAQNTVNDPMVFKPSATLEIRSICYHYTVKLHCHISDTRNKVNMLSLYTKAP